MNIKEIILQKTKNNNERKKHEYVNPLLRMKDWPNGSWLRYLIKPR